MEPSEKSFSTQKYKILGAVDGDSRPLNRIIKGAQHLAVMDWPRKLFLRINSNAGDPDFSEADRDLIPDSRSGFRVPKGLGSGEAIELRSVLFGEFLFAGRGHGYNGVVACARDLGGDYSA